jgi:hypothetical protein
MTTIIRTPEAVRTRKMEAMRSVFQKVVRIMSGKLIRVQVDSHNVPAPGYTDGKDIFLNREHIVGVLSDPNFNDGDFFDLICRLWGIVYHELSHILHSPRAGDFIPSRAIEMAQQHTDPSWWYAYNGLEDQRIETWFTALYRPTKRFFEAAVLQWLMNTPESVEKAHILTYGRRYLSPAIRKQAQVAFIARYGQQLADEAEACIDTYVGLVFPTEDVLGWRCVTEFQRIIRLVTPAGQELPHQPSEDNDPRCTTGFPDKRNVIVISKGRPSVKTQRDALEEMEAIDFDAEPETDSEEDESDQPAKAAKSDGKKSTWDLSGHKVDDDETDGEDPKEDEEDSDPQTGAGTAGAEASKPDLRSAMEELVKMAAESLDECLDDVEGSIDSIIDDIYDAMRNDDGLGGHLLTNGQDVPVEPETSLTARRCVDAVNRLRIDLEAQKVSRQNSGRINMKRMLTAPSHQVDMFDQWDTTGEDVGGIEVVLCVDLSGSMGGIMGLVSRTLWSLKHAFDTVDIQCTVLGFETDWCVLYRPGERADLATYRLFGAMGGTSPTDCLKEAMKILDRSQQPNRALVTVTDGSWSADPGSIQRILDGFHRNNGESLLVGLNEAHKYHGRHSHTAGKDIDTIEQLPSVVMLLVESMLKRAARLHMG